MTTRRFVVVGLLAAVLLSGAALAVAASSSGYTLDWFTVDGGGGHSLGGRYALDGSIGQPDAGTLTGGGYTLRGGFWVNGVAASFTYLPVVRR